MKTYLSLKRFTPYFENNCSEFITLFGIYFLTESINEARQFYANYYLCEALGIKNLPHFEDLLKTLEDIGQEKSKIEISKNGKINFKQSLLKNSNEISFQKEFKINIEDYPHIYLGHQKMIKVIKEINSLYSDDLLRKDKFNIQNFNKKDINFLNKNGYLVIDNFFKKEMLEKVTDIFNKIAKKERATGNAYLYGKEGKNQRVYNLISKHSIFRDILESAWLESFLDRYFYRPTFHEKYGLSSFAAHIIVPGGEDMPLHIDNAVPNPIPKDWPMRLVVVIPLCDFSKENGTTYVVPESNKLLKKPTFEDEKKHKGIHVSAKAGSLMIWDGNIWHKSTKNKSTRERAGLIISYGASFFKEICGEEEHLAVVPKKLQKEMSPRLKSLIGYGRGIKKGASYIPDYE
jgi:hypothetical protein